MKSTSTCIYSMQKRNGKPGQKELIQLLINLVVLVLLKMKWHHFLTNSHNDQWPMTPILFIPPLIPGYLLESQYFTVPHLFLQESSHSSGIHRNSQYFPFLHWFRPDSVDFGQNPGIPEDSGWNQQESDWNRQRLSLFGLYFALLFQTNVLELGNWPK